MPSVLPTPSVLLMPNVLLTLGALPTVCHHRKLNGRRSSHG